MGKLTRYARQHKYRLSAAAVALVAAIFAFTGPADAQSAFTIRPAANTGYCIEATGGNWTDATLPSCTDNAYEGWYEGSGYRGYVTLINYATGKCLQDGNDGGSGTVMTVYTCNGSESQGFSQVGQTWVMADGLCLDNGYKEVRAWTCNGTNSQTWDEESLP